MKRLLKRLEEMARGSNRDKTIEAVYKKFSSSDKMKRGGKHKVMLTGNVAKVLGKEAHDSVFLQDMSDEELGKLAKLLKVEGVEESYPGRGAHIGSDLEKRFPREYAAFLKKAKEGADAEKKFFAGKGPEYFEMANRLHAEADTLYRALKKKAGW